MAAALAVILKHDRDSRRAASAGRRNSPAAGRLMRPAARRSAVVLPRPEALTTELTYAELIPMIVLPPS
jgi:hypothetical protein